MGFGGKVDKASNQVISGEGWPDLTNDEFRQLRRIPHTFDNDSIAVAITIAANNIQEKLVSLLVEGMPPSLSVAKTALYKRAVYGRAHSEFATQDRRKEGDNAALDEPQQAARFLAQSNKDVSQLLGRSANGIGVI